jgi:hypothetical protein
MRVSFLAKKEQIAVGITKLYTLKPLHTLTLGTFKLFLMWKCAGEFEVARMSKL